MRKKALTVIAAITVVAAFCLINEIRENLFVAEAERTAPYKVERVVDGDTFIIDMNGIRERVRLIGLDAPESVHPDESKNTDEGRLASEFAKEMLEGKMVTLEFDVQERDKYGRILAYVYLEDEMFNKILIREGHAQAVTYPPNVKYQDEFRKIQKERGN